MRFHPGLNLLTGETGSGKSIVVDALGLLLGGRASPEMVRTGATRARISGIFEVAETPALAKLLEDAGIEMEDRELLVEREIQAGGKSRAFVGNRPATAALLKDLAVHLADIHGQHDQQQLFSPPSSATCWTRSLQPAILQARCQKPSMLGSEQRRSMPISTAARRRSFV